MTISIHAMTKDIMLWNFVDSERGPSGCKVSRDTKHAHLESSNGELK
jgi:hypothetical protein